jgi:hypothetical protein
VAEHPDGTTPVPGPSDDAVRADLAELSDLMAVGVEVDGEVQVTESTWVIYGHMTYDGEIVVGEYHDAAEATAVFRAVSRPDPDPHAGRAGPDG